jgi:hypothetical protein
VKTTFRRLQQLERRRSEWLAATDTSGVREQFMAHINRMAARLRADPNWRPPTPEQAEATMRHFKAYFAAKANGTS